MVPIRSIGVVVVSKLADEGQPDVEKELSDLLALDSWPSLL